MSKKTNWTPSAQTIVKKAETRFRKKIKAAKDKHERLVSRHARLAAEITKAAAELARVTKGGAELTPAEQKAKSADELKLKQIVELHEKKKLSFADIGKKLKISHAWAHALYRSHRGGKPKVKDVKKTKPAKSAKKADKKAAKPSRKPAAKKAKTAAPKTPKQTPAISEGASWGDNATGA